MRHLLFVLSLAVLPVSAFANSGYTSGKPVNFEDSRYQKWASMTAEERDLAKQRSTAGYKDWQHYKAARDAQMNRSYKHHPDQWQGKTAEEKDKILQRNSVYERAHPRNTGHHPDKWQGQTAEEKDAIKQRHSVYERAHPTRDGKYHSAKQAERMSAAEQAKETYRAQEEARKAAAARKAAHR